MQSSRRWRWLRALGGVAILGAVVHTWGAAPFLHAVRGIDLRLLALAAGIAVATTLCSAWRWSLVAGGLGTRLPLATALAGCYRSQLLNSTLPGGVLGDIHRGVHHGPVVGGVGLGLRTVWWERTAGQVVLLSLTVTTLLVAPSALRPSAPILVAVLTTVTLAAACLWGAVLHRARGGSSRASAAVRAVGSDVRRGVLASSVWPGVLLTSVIIVAGHVLTFVLAVRAAGAAAPLETLLPLGLLVLVASGLPINIAGWGPREGAAAWLFGAAGLGASTGVTAAALYGVLALVATSPGLLVLGRDALRASRANARRRQLASADLDAPQHPVASGRARRAMQRGRALPGSPPVRTWPAQPVPVRVRTGGRRG
jgi:hypothetical protein